MTKRSCPECGAPLLPAVYGMPPPDVFDAESRGECIIMGCDILLDSPEFGCAQRLHWWRKDASRNLVPAAGPDQTLWGLVLGPGELDDGRNQLKPSANPHLDSCPSLRLRTGVELADPLALARSFISEDSSYKSYDLPEVSNDNVLSENDVRIANRIIARMGPGPIAAILSRGSAASTALARIPPNASLVDRDVAIPWEALQDLYSAFEGLPGVGLARLTKVLHKKRPALIPILDSVVDRYLVAVEGPIVGSLGHRGSELTRSYKKELDACLPVLTCVRKRLLEEGIDLTECRLLDIYLWAYSGQYDPVWQRSGSSLARQKTRESAARPSLRGENVNPNVEVFRDAESAYLGWIVRHPIGWVVNSSRSPTPSYLLLHRADCWTIGPHGSGNYTTREYIKTCSSERMALESWAASSVGGDVTLCGFCEGRIARESMPVDG